MRPMIYDEHGDWVDDHRCPSCNTPADELCGPCGTPSGRLAYEADRVSRPRYSDGSPRPKWEDTTPLARWSWERKARG